MRLIVISLGYTKLEPRSELALKRDSKEITENETKTKTKTNPDVFLDMHTVTVGKYDPSYYVFNRLIWSSILVYISVRDNITLNSFGN